ncbi:hypothetical protein MHM93_10180 [Pseudoalteromonas sp. MM17-2]|uniref:hypothetical protein n=1 Tax=Pseudoalteromonas sp. MM17-2 TaxID=2917753 RepID=UPI001EF72FA1|nr:hypothetical protein [Pseudoalteromonas sp. MM17-2]MCG7544549.1 hypothetical protein [Pseudoalteromonas sp. MM17-2]
MITITFAILLSFTASEYELAGKTSAALILCSQLNTQVKQEQISKYIKFERELNNLFSLSGENEKHYIEGQVLFIDSFAHIEKSKPVDEQLLSPERCDDHLQAAKKLIIRAKGNN